MLSFLFCQTSTRFCFDFLKLDNSKLTDERSDLKKNIGKIYSPFGKFAERAKLAKSGKHSGRAK